MMKSTAGTLTSSSSTDHGIGIVEFLQGNNFFITGATGSLGKVLVEKIFRSTPKVGKIFLLVRGKDKQEALLRVRNEIADAALFKRLKEIHGNLFQDLMRSKVIPVVGDVCEPNLGMDTLTTAEIAEEIDVIVNSAANTTWDERYDVSLNTNAKGPARLLEFAKKCKKLKLLVHVSTAYVNGKRPGVFLEKPLCMEEEEEDDEISKVEQAIHVPFLDVDSELKLASDTMESYDGAATTTTTNNLDQKKYWKKTMERVIRLAQLYEPYTFTEARFDMENTKKVMEEMCGEEVTDFGFEVESIRWEYYFKTIHLPGLRRHALKLKLKQPLAVAAAAPTPTPRPGSRM
ncbi:hypothetical protein Tsubulata_040718 [Turnera subulata]|uniref:Fatty acyl-CoA reductase n=1 Tax=Turnera subulata TaxID=218843 RepID=A0A9Q0G9C4_9ROSI|nr:hypothetical protein Tsubulata_040718 [Turnera subulata]